jgi:hypothetical protein
VQVDRETGGLLRLTYTADASPRTYPIQSSTTSVKYDDYRKFSADSNISFSGGK